MSVCVCAYTEYMHVASRSLCAQSVSAEAFLPALLVKACWLAEVMSSGTLQHEHWGWRALPKSWLCYCLLCVLGQNVYLSKPHFCYLDNEDKSSAYFSCDFLLLVKTCMLNIAPQRACTGSSRNDSCHYYRSYHHHSVPTGRESVGAANCLPAQCAICFPIFPMHRCFSDHPEPVPRC